MIYTETKLCSKALNSMKSHGNLSMSSSINHPSHTALCYDRFHSVTCSRLNYSRLLYETFKIFYKF